MSKKIWFFIILLAIILIVSAGYFISVTYIIKQQTPRKVGLPRIQEGLKYLLKDNLKTNYLPDQQLNLTQKSPSDPYEAEWVKEDTKFSAKASYAEPETLSNFELSIQPKGLSVATISGVITVHFVEKYFNKELYSPFKCDRKGNISFCENFTSGQIIKTGIGLASFGSSNSAFIFYCYIHKDNPDFNTRSSCLLYNELPRSRAARYR